MSSADFLKGENNIAVVRALLVRLCKTSRDKILNFLWVLPDLLTLSYGWILGVPNLWLGCPLKWALYLVSVRQNCRFANGFFQICGRPQHLCQSL